MTDRELLEAAAKAEGHEVEFSGLSGFTFWSDRFTQVLWDPLHNDGDALRLAVNLGFMIIPNGYGGVDVGVTIDDAPFGDCLSSESDVDLYAATRRAIVRAAASIGAKT
jgi:hypothetical protein